MVERSKQMQEQAEQAHQRTPEEENSGGIFTAQWMPGMMGMTITSNK